MTLIKFALLSFFLATSVANARGRSGGASGAFSGESSIGIELSVGGPSQDDLNGVVDSINALQSRSTNKLGTSYEISVDYQSRLSGTIFAIQYRPSYFTQSATGSGYDTKLVGMTFFPMLRLYPLENGFIHFFLQGGIGYGKLSGSMTGPFGSVNWSGESFGMQGGLGAEFMITDSQAIMLEGNLRYMPIQRNITSSTTGTPSGFSQTAGGYELESNGTDTKTTLSGVYGVVGYRFIF